MTWKSNDSASLFNDFSASGLVRDSKTVVRFADRSLYCDDAAFFYFIRKAELETFKRLDGLKN